MRNKMKHLVYLEFSDGEVPVFWKFHLKQSEVDLFRKEVDIYNQWISFLFRGLAPNSAYEDPNTGHKIIFAQNEKYEEFFKLPDERHYYEYKRASYNFTICDMDDTVEDPDLLEDFRRNAETNLSDCSELINIITKPWGKLEFYMGYKLLPMTERIINK